MTYIFREFIRLEASGGILLILFTALALAWANSQWSDAYFEPGWQAFFDLFNSLPLIALGAVIAWRARAAVP